MVYSDRGTVGWAKALAPPLVKETPVVRRAHASANPAWARRTIGLSDGETVPAPLPTLYRFRRSKPVCTVDWRGANLPGATMPTPCREHHRRTCAPAERPRRGPVGGLPP